MDDLKTLDFVAITSSPFLVPLGLLLVFLSGPNLGDESVRSGWCPRWGVQRGGGAQRVAGARARPPSGGQVRREQPREGDAA